MIKKQSNHYYTIEGLPQPDNISPTGQSQSKPALALETVGNVKQYLQHVSAQVAIIKELKKKQREQQMANLLVLDGLNSETSKQVSSGGHVDVQIRIPEELCDIDQRITKLEQKILNDQITRQKLQRKGKLSQRSRHLLTQLQKLHDRGIESLSTPITNFTKNIDQREQNHKILFLYQTFTKTSSLSQEIEMLDVYLNNLAEITRKYQALVPVSTIVEMHDKVLDGRAANANRIRDMYKWMVEEYEKLVKQIDSL